MPHYLDIIVDDTLAGTRLDKALAASTDLTRSKARRVISQGACRVNGVRIKHLSHPLEVGDRVYVGALPPEPSPHALDTPDLVIAYADDDLVVVDKAPRQLSHGSPKGDAGSVSRLLLERQQALHGPSAYVALHHRLDRDATGLLVAAVSKRANRSLAAQFKGRTLTKVYVAILGGAPPEDAGTIDLPLRWIPDRRIAVVDRFDGQPAETRYRVIARTPQASLVVVTLVTGRTHQIRAHFGSLGVPLLGDDHYGALPSTGPFPLALRASGLLLAHPVTKEPIRLSAPPSPVMLEAFAMGHVEAATLARAIEDALDGR